jgi:hypothetical protein
VLGVPEKVAIDIETLSLPRDQQEKGEKCTTTEFRSQLLSGTIIEFLMPE